MCVYGRGGVCVHGEREGVCIQKGWSVYARGEGGVECASLSPCTHTPPLPYTHPSPYALSPCMDTPPLPYTHQDVCIWKGWSVRARGEGGCVYTEGVECVCTGRGRMCVYERGGVCVHGERDKVCI